MGAGVKPRIDAARRGKSQGALCTSRFLLSPPNPRLTKGLFSCREGLFMHTKSAYLRKEADMKATVLEMRRNPKKILDAIERNETATLTNRGKSVARIEPIRNAERPRVEDLDIFGMWADREDMPDPVAYVRSCRNGRVTVP